MTIVGAHGLDAEDDGVSPQIAHASDGKFLEAPAAAVLSSDPIFNPDVARSQQSAEESAGSGPSLFSFMSDEASSVLDTAASASSESLASQVPLEGSVIVESPNLLGAPAAAVLSSDSIFNPDVARSQQSAEESAGSGPSLFSFMSGEASSVLDTAASASSESLASQVPLEGSVEDAGSSFAFLNS
jgi:hypothetical protein